MSLLFSAHRQKITSTLVTALCVGAPLLAHSQTLDKGHQILLTRGLQSYGLVTTGDVFHLNTLKNANFTAVMFPQGDYNCSLLGSAPGFPWSRWASSQSDMPPQASPTNEAPYMGNLQAVSIGDEQDMNQLSVRTATAAWYNAVRSSFPQTILSSNSWAYQWLDANYDAFIQTSNPDMLSMDTYEYVTGNALTPGGSPTNLYHGMRQMRAYATAYGKPYQLYTQTYHSTGDGRRDPSDSELRQNYFAGVVFGCTSFVSFWYNNGASSLFTTPGGDSNPTALYSTITSINSKLKKLSPALTRLVPRNNYIGGFDASMLYYPGQYFNGSTTVTLTQDGDFRVYPTDYNTYFSTNDPYLKGVVVTNTGTRNNGLRGDMWMMWFKPLDEAFDGPNYSNQVYVMVFNGLSDPTGTAADCHQQIKVNYVDATPTQNLQVLNQTTGNIDTVALPIVSTRRQATFELDGGECVLYKFNTGAPFVGTYQTAAENWELLQ